MWPVFRRNVIVQINSKALSTILRTDMPCAMKYVFHLQQAKSYAESLISIILLLLLLLSFDIIIIYLFSSISTCSSSTISILSLLLLLLLLLSSLLLLLLLLLSLLLLLLLLLLCKYVIFIITFIYINTEQYICKKDCYKNDAFRDSTDLSSLTLQVLLGRICPQFRHSVDINLAQKVINPYLIEKRQKTASSIFLAMETFPGKG